MPMILLVCTGNMCRSPMAEGLLRRYLILSGRTGWHITSAGTWTVPGRSATPEATAVMKLRGIDLSSHRSREVDTNLMAEADLILVMTRSHAEALRVEFPQHAGKIRLFAYMAGKSDDIEDPIGGTVAAYDACAGQLDQILNEGMPVLEQWMDKCEGLE